MGVTRRVVAIVEQVIVKRTAIHLYVPVDISPQELEQRALMEVTQTGTVAENTDGWPIEERAQATVIGHYVDDNWPEPGKP